MFILTIIRISCPRDVILSTKRFLVLSCDIRHEALRLPAGKTTVIKLGFLRLVAWFREKDEDSNGYKQLQQTNIYDDEYISSITRAV